MVKRQEIVEAARSMLGTKWVHQGRQPKLGVDCIGMILCTARKLGLTEYEPPPYEREAQWGLFLQYFRQNLQEIPNGVCGDLKPGDILTFRQKIFPCHCGILTEVGPDPKFIHAFLTRKRVVEERLTPDWKRVCLAAFRFPNLED